MLSTFPAIVGEGTGPAPLSFADRQSTIAPRKEAGDPPLLFTHDELDEIVDEFDGPDTTIITDSHNAPVLRKLRGLHVIESADHTGAEAIRRGLGTPPATVIGVGGCTALDVARYMAGPSSRLVIIPSILSTSCISVNRSVLYRNGLHQSLRTSLPATVIISFPLILAGDQSLVWKWSQSGFGDVFANLSAALDAVWRKQIEPDATSGHLPPCSHLVPAASQALDWVLTRFRRFDDEAIENLARFIHESSLEVVRADSVELSAAGEHDLYYNLLCDRRYPHHQPTHGQIVAAGTLLATRSYSKAAGVEDLFERLSEAFRLLQLPRSYAELERAGLPREHLLAALHAIRTRTTFLAWSFRTWGPDFVDSVFNGQS